MARGGRRRRVVGAIGLSVALVTGTAAVAWNELAAGSASGDRPVRVVPVVALPEARTDGATSFEQSLLRRISVREFRPEPLTLAQLGQLLWSAQGEVGDGRNVPSAGALHPLELYVAHEGGIYHYRPSGHEVAAISGEDIRAPLAEAALDQAAVRSAPAVVAIAGVEGRTARKYGDRAERYVLIEVGHAAQNLLLQAAVIGLGAVPIGAFHDAEVAELFGMPEGTEPLYLIPVGVPS